MTLYSDCMDALRKVGHLPEVTVANVIAQEEKINAQEEKIIALADENEALKKKIAELEAQQK